MPQPKQIPINLSLLEDVTCPNKEMLGKCGNKYFRKIFTLKVVPKLLVGAPENGLAAVEQHQCMKCGYVLKPSDL